MKLQAEIGGDQHQIELRRNGDAVTAIIDEAEFDVEVSEPEPNVFLIKKDGKVYETYVAPAKGLGQPRSVTVNGREFEIKLIDPKRLRSSAGSDESTDGTAEIKTAMPGKVVRILVEVGAAVNKGDGVLVVEAMKMQNELKSPKDGTVKEIRFAEGDTVTAGEVLATIE
ncbi:MAG: biotin/lipoyl-containing protein [Pyrinomonadaceae bacterium]